MSINCYYHSPANGRPLQGVCQLDSQQPLSQRSGLTPSRHHSQGQTSLVITGFETGEGARTPALRPHPAQLGSELQAVWERGGAG